MKSLVRNISNFWAIDLTPTNKEIETYGTPKTTPRHVVSVKKYVPDIQKFIGTYDYTAMVVNDSNKTIFGSIDVPEVVDAVTESNLKSSIRLADRVKLDPKLQRKIQSIDCKRESTTGTGSARIVLANLTMSEAESTQLLLKTVLRISFGKFDWFALTKTSAVMFQGAITEKQVTFGEDGIGISLILRELTDLFINAPFPVDFFYPGDGIETFEDAMDSLGKFLGCPIYYSMSPEEILNYEADALATIEMKRLQDKGVKAVEFVDPKLVGLDRIKIKSIENQKEDITDQKLGFKIYSLDKKLVWRDFFFKNPKGNYTINPVTKAPSRKTPADLLAFICDYYRFEFFTEGNAIYIRGKGDDNEAMPKKYFYYRQMPKVGRIPFLENIQFAQITEDSNGDLFDKFEMLETYGTTAGAKGLSENAKKERKALTTERLKNLQILQHNIFQMSSAGADLPEAQKLALNNLTILKEQLVARINEDKPAIYGDLVVTESGVESNVEAMKSEKDPKMYQAKYGRGNSSPDFGRITGATGDINFKLRDKFEFFGGNIYSAEYQAVAIEYIFDNNKNFTMNIVGRAIKKIDQLTREFAKKNPIPVSAPVMYVLYNEDAAGSNQTGFIGFNKNSGKLGQGWFYHYEGTELVARMATKKEWEDWWTVGNGKGIADLSKINLEKKMMRDVLSAMTKEKSRLESNQK